MKKSVYTLFCLAVLLPLSCGKSGTEDPFGGGGSGSGSGSGMSEQREALIKIYNAAEGDGWYLNTNWCTDADLDSWYGITTNTRGSVTKIILNKNNVGGYLPDVFDKFPDLEEINFTTNKISGKIPQTLKDVKLGAGMAKLQYNEFETTEFKVPNDRIEAVAEAMRVYPQNTGNEAFRIFVDSEVDGTGKVHPDCSLEIYQQHTEGAGVELYITGDGYDEAENTVGGSAEYWYKVAAEAFFDIEPYTKLRKYFDVYIIYVHSPEKGVTLYENKRNSRFSYNSTNSNINTSVCGQCVAQALGRNMQDSSAVQVCINSTHNAIGGGVELRRTNAYGYSIGYGICQQRPTAFRDLVKHETGGHAFGYLLDEYLGSKTAADLPAAMVRINKVANIDVEKDPAKVKWHMYIEDPRYAGEDVGVYDGGFAFAAGSGVYRPSATSMLFTSGKRVNMYNAPSRAEIYRHAMRKAFPKGSETPFEWDYEAFVKFDLNL